MRYDDTFFTPQAIARMRRDLDMLTTRERPVAADEVHRLAQMGDFSENAAYQFAKAHLRRINGRITAIEEHLKRAVPIAPGSDDGVIRIGSTVSVRSSAGESTFTIVGSHEASPSAGRISHLSPLGAALLGKCVGGIATLTTDRKITYAITDVR